MDTLKANQLAYKKQVGKTEEGDPIWEIATKGGLHLVMKPKGQKFETLGTGPHRAIARHLAEKRCKITWTELNKSDHLDYHVMEPLLPKYAALTEIMRRVEGSDS